MTRALGRAVGILAAFITLYLASLLALAGTVALFVWMVVALLDLAGV